MRSVVAWAAWMSLGLVVGCRPAAEQTEKTEGRAQAQIAAALGRGAVMLDRSASGAVLLGQPRPVPADTDGARVLSLRWLDERGVTVPTDALGDVEDARFVPGETGLVAVRENAELVLLDAPGANARVLGRDAHGPLSVAPHAVAFAQGQPPELEIARADLRSGVVRAVTVGQAPCWSPALSPDGDAVLYVSATSGLPELYVVRGNAAPRRLSRRAEGEIVPFPTSPRAPTWVGDEHRGTLSFGDETGERSLALGTLRANVGGAR